MHNEHTELRSTSAPDRAYTCIHPCIMERYQILEAGSDISFSICMSLETLYTSLGRSMSAAARQVCSVAKHRSSFDYTFGDADVYDHQMGTCTSLGWASVAVTGMVKAHATVHHSLADEQRGALH